jgi:hypothetical protein
LLSTSLELAKSDDALEVRTLTAGQRGTERGWRGGGEGVERGRRGGGDKSRVFVPSIPPVPASATQSRNFKCAEMRARISCGQHACAVTIIIRGEERVSGVLP